MLFSILLLSISLSIDAFGIGASYGLRGIEIPISTKIITSLQSTLIMSLALFCGNWLGKIFPPEAAKVVGVLILAVMGIWMIRQALLPEKESKNKSNPDGPILSFLIKSMGVTIQIVRTPQYCDFDNSSSIEPKEAIYLGFALSIDSFGAGIGSSAAGLAAPMIPFLTALCQVVFLTAGRILGKKLSFFGSRDENFWEFCSGILLIFIGLIRLI